MPELVDLSKEPKSTFELYGPTPASRALSPMLPCWPGGWSSGASLRADLPQGLGPARNVAGRLPSQCKDVDRACYGLITDLKQRGMLNDTLIIWGGEFGRTIYSQGGLSHQNYGRDHHPRASPCGCAAAASSRAWSMAKPTISPTISPRTPSDPRLPRHDPAPAGLRPRATDYRYQGLDSGSPASSPRRWSRRCWRKGKCVKPSSRIRQVRRGRPSVHRALRDLVDVHSNRASQTLMESPRIQPA